MEIVGHNQILVVFVLENKGVFIIHRYNGICNYYFQPGDHEMDDKAELVEENFGNKVENEDGL